MTLLEVVLAVALLAMIGAAMLSAIGGIDSMQMRGKMQLSACEVGNRLLLQYLHDERKMPPEALPLDYGSFRFMYALEVEKVRMELNAELTRGENSPQGLDRYEHVTVTVFQAEQVGESVRAGEQVAQITRILDPFAPRNPETLATFNSDPTRVHELISKLGIGGGSGGGGGGGGKKGK